MLVLDDCGFAQLGCFGAEIETPTIDRLAQDGVRMNSFHVTALCSRSGSGSHPQGAAECDQAITMIRDQQQATPGKPFFMYFATTTPHSPHHVPREWSDRYRGRFDTRVDDAITCGSYGTTDAP